MKGDKEVQRNEVRTVIDSNELKRPKGTTDLYFFCAYL